jgi:hypothetical protein
MRSLLRRELKMARSEALSRVVLAVLLLLGSAAASPVAHQGQAVADDQIWPEFVALLKRGSLDESRLKPAYVKPATMLQFLSSMRASATWSEWERQPEIYRVGSLVHFVTRLSEGKSTGTYSFTFVVEDGHWFLQHFESIVIRLDRIGALPVSNFPDIGESQKAWMRQENYWSAMLGEFVRKRATVGDKAYEMFLDGAGYLVQAKTWVPLVAPARAFILFSCWEQSRLHGNEVTLEKLDDREAIVTMDSIFLRLYRQTGHIRERLSEEDYRRIFETIWHDRAAAAGWDVSFAYNYPRCTLRYTKKLGS